MFSKPFKIFMRGYSWEDIHEKILMCVQVSLGTCTLSEPIFLCTPLHTPQDPLHTFSHVCAGFARDLHVMWARDLHVTWAQNSLHTPSQTSKSSPYFQSCVCRFRSGLARYVSPYFYAHPLTHLRIFSMSSSKPMSSIWSASSRMAYRTWE